MVVKNPTFVKTFAEFGLFNCITSEIKSSLEKFAFGRKHQKSVNIVLTLLPPCELNLSQNIDRDNYVSRHFCSAKRLMMCLDDPYDHGWNSDCTVRWDETYFTQVLVDMNADTGETIDNDSDRNDDNCEPDSDIGYDEYINK